MPQQYILVKREEPIATAIINRPDKLNALNWDLIAELADELEKLDADEAIGCIVLTGAGDRAFAAGADIAEMSDASTMRMATGSFENWDRIRRIHKPIIAAVGGFALGGGNELAMHADIIVASEKAKFGQPEILLGIMPGAGGTQRLAHTVGKYKAMEMCLTGDQFTAHNMALNVDPRAYHAYSFETVSESDSGRLLEEFLRLPIPRVFLYGEANRNLSYLARLRESAIRVIEIPAAAHFLFWDNPVATFEAIGEFVHSARS